MFAELGADIIYIHPEADIHAPRTLQSIIDCGAKAGIAINPGTTVEVIRPLLSLAEYVLVMTVNPGFAGQKYLPFVDEKIDVLLSLKQQYGYHIMIDGACSPDVIRTLSAKGVEGFVLGTSALFGKDKSYKDIMKSLRGL
jgi:ribulose-phosphate 3-epimerase